VISTWFIIWFSISFLIGVINTFISSHILKLIKGNSNALYEEITEGYDERWTMPVSSINNYTDRPMIRRLHQAIISGKCTEYVSERLYWGYRITGWIATPLPYVFLLFFAYLLYVFIQAVVGGYESLPYC
jgi:hypothetical protein